MYSTYHEQVIPPTQGLLTILYLQEVAPGDALCLYDPLFTSSLSVIQLHESVNSTTSLCDSEAVPLPPPPALPVLPVISLLGKVLKKYNVLCVGESFNDPGIMVNMNSSFMLGKALYIFSPTYVYNRSRRCGWP